MLHSDAPGAIVHPVPRPVSRRPGTAALVLLLAFAATAQAADDAQDDAQNEGALRIEAQHIEGASDAEVSARGGVSLERDDTRIESDTLRFNREFGRIEAEGNVRIERERTQIVGSRLRYDARDDSGRVDSPTYRIEGPDTARGSAARLDLLGRDRLRMDDATFTTCTPDREDWVLRVGELNLDYGASEGRARDATLKLLDTDVGPLPEFSFPLDRQRKSGFLTPRLSQSTRRGFEVRTPYYWNISPEQDATITPSVMTRRGMQLRGEYRYLGSNFTGDTRLEYLPNDREYGESRYGYSIFHNHQFTPNTLARIDLNRVSDDAYFVDLSSQVRQVSIRNLQREAFVQHLGAIGAGTYGVQARVQRFQTLQDPKAPIVPPYHRLPQVVLNAQRNDIGGVVDLNVPAELVYFAHDSLVDGTRVGLNPTLALPVRRPGWFAVPKVGLRFAGYDLSGTAAAAPSRPTVTIPWMSVDSGLVFERPTQWFGERLTQTLEPRLFYVRIPYRDQNAIPNFDTALADFNYAQIFSENRFAGGDRFGDANEVTLAATSRLIGFAGQEILRATLGQRYYFDDEQVGLQPGAPLRTYRDSDWLAAIGGRASRSVLFDAALQYNQRDERTERFTLAARYAPDTTRLLNASYRQNRSSTLRQVDFSGRWPVSAGTYAVGRYNYSLIDSTLVEAVAGIEHNAGCWLLRLVGTRVQAATGVATSAVFFQLELNGLGHVGTDEAVNVLRRNVPGYTVTHPRALRTTSEDLR